MNYLYLVAFLSGIINSLLGAGGGTVAVIILLKTIENKQNVFSTLCAFVLPTTIISVAILNEKVSLEVILPICLGGIFGGFLGNKLLKKIKSEYLTITFSLFIIFIGVKSLL